LFPLLLCRLLRRAGSIYFWIERRGGTGPAEPDPGAAPRAETSPTAARRESVFNRGGTGGLGGQGGRRVPSSQPGTCYRCSWAAALCLSFPACAEGDHRTIIEWIGLEGTLMFIQSNTLPWAGTLPPAQGAQSPVQPGLGHCQGGGSHSFSGQAGLGPRHPHGEEFLPNL